MHHPQAMLASPMTPVMRHQQHQQQQSHYASPYHGSFTQHLSPGGMAYEGQSGTPQFPPMATPQSNARFPAHAASPGSNQPYTCYVCNATATSRKNYIAHLQVSYLHHRHKFGHDTAAFVSIYHSRVILHCHEMLAVCY